MGTNKSVNNLRLEFSRVTRSTPNFSENEKLHHPLLPISSQDDSRGKRCRKEKKTLFGASEHFFELQIVTNAYPRHGSGILTTLPFTSNERSYYTEFSRRLGTTNP